MAWYHGGSFVPGTSSKPAVWRDVAGSVAGAADTVEDNGSGTLRSTISPESLNGWPVVMDVDFGASIVFPTTVLPETYT